MSTCSLKSRKPKRSKTMTSEELEQLKAYTKEVTKAKGIKFDIEDSLGWVITFVQTAKTSGKAGLSELYGGRKLSAHKRAIDEYVKDQENPARARKRQNRYHRGAPDFPTLII